MAEAAAAFRAPPSRKGGDAPVELSLRILATSDLHANVLSYDYAGNRKLFGQGMAQTASLIAAARAEAPEAFLLDNGDFLQGSALADMAAREGRKRLHPVIGAMNALGYDAASLGNHEFNFGLPVLMAALAGARFPVVSANVLLQRGDGPLQDRTLVPPYALIDRVLTDSRGGQHRFRLGVLGLTPPEILQWDSAHLAGRVEVRPMLEAARAWAPELRRAGADLVVCLAHTGIAEGAGLPDSSGLATEVAGLEQVDVVVAGHSHLVFPHRSPHDDPRVDPAEGRLAGKPAVQPGFSGSHLGVVDLVLHRTPGEGAGKGPGVGAWRVAQTRVQALSVSEVVAGLPPQAIRHNAAALREAVDGDHRAALAWTRKTIGSTGVAMATWFAQVAETPALHLVSAAKIDHVRRALAGGPHAGLPVVATAVPYRCGGRGGPLNYTDIAPGPISVRHLFDLYPFPNTVAALRVTAADLAEQIERSLALYNWIRPGRRDQPLIDPAFPGHAFATFHGVDYLVDLSRPARFDCRGALIRPEARRVVRMSVQGQPLAPDQPLILVSSNFRVSSILGLPRPAPGDLVLERGGLMTDVLRRFILQRGHVDAGIGAGLGHWGFAPLPGASVLIDSGVGAPAALDNVARFRPDFLGLSEEGFHRFRLHL
ncbi:MAG: 5'-nucleotidase C-terminal domain-containing protein [Paracoccaceae bacterium]